MKYSNEVEIMKALGITSWRNLSKEKMVKFAAMMPDMDKEVALKIVEQLPEFRKFASDSVGTVERAHEATLKANQESQNRVHEAFQEIRSILKGELAKEDLSWEQQKYIYDLLMETGTKQAEKDTENKKNLGGWLKGVGIVAASALALGVVFVGGRILLEGNNGDSDSEETSEA